jgi:hypothetical protein
MLAYDGVGNPTTLTPTDYMISLELRNLRIIQLALQSGWNINGEAMAGSDRSWIESVMIHRPGKAIKVIWRWRVVVVPDEYFRWNSEIRAWRNRILQADLRPFAPDWFRIDLRSCAPIADQVPIVDFEYFPSAPRPDVIFTGSEWEPFSSRLRFLLRREGVTMQEFPCRLIDRRTEAILSEDYAVVHFPGCSDCLDWNNSIYTPAQDSLGRPVASSISRLVLQQHCLRAASPLVRLKGASRLTLVHQRLRHILESQGISGVTYLPLQDDQGF